MVPPRFAAYDLYGEEDWYGDYEGDFEYEDPYGWGEYGAYDDESWDPYEMAEDWDDEYGYAFDPYEDEEFYDEEYDYEEWDYEAPYEDWSDEDDYY